MALVGILRLLGRLQAKHERFEVDNSTITLIVSQRLLFRGLAPHQ